jgi:hypothetical protein
MAAGSGGLPVLIFPRASLDQGAITAMRRRANIIAQELARGTNSAADIIPRPLRATDVNGGVNVLGRLTNPNALVADTYATDQFPNWTPSQAQGMVLYGYTVLAGVPLIDEITITVGADVLGILPLDEIYAQGGPEAKVGFLFEPIAIPPTLHCKIDLLSNSAVVANSESFAFIGYVGEAAGTKVGNQPARTASQETYAMSLRAATGGLQAQF